MRDLDGFFLPYQSQQFFCIWVTTDLQTEAFSPLVSVMANIAISIATRHFVFSYYVCLKISVLGILEVQWSELELSLPESQVGSLVEELRSHKPRGQNKQKNKTKICVFKYCDCHASSISTVVLEIN